MFGCAFLSDEREASFIWLFRSFLESMGGRAPKTIVTDQDQAMGNAIEKVFPDTRHRLCLWHISKNAPSHLKLFNSNPQFRKLFFKCLKECESEDEFEETWKKMLIDYSLQDHSWLNKLYKIKQKWCTGLNKDVFSAGILSSQRVESTNHVLNDISSKSTSLTKFVLEFEKRVADWRSSELEQDFRCKQGMPPLLVKDSRILNQAMKFYTYKIFKFFEKEMYSSIASTSRELESYDDIFIFEVIVGGETQSKAYTVCFNISTLDISCSCKKFEFMGLLCCHALRVLNIKNVTKIPEKYFLNRWAKDAKKRLLEYEHERSSKNGGGETETVFRNYMMRYAYNLITKCQGNELTRQMCRNSLFRMDADVERELAKKKLTADCGMVENKDNNDTNVLHEMADSVPVLNPPHVRPKGVSNARLKGHLEKRKKKSAKEATNSRILFS